MQVLGIVGLDYCGSTVISNVLSGLPGAINVGESHWIVDRNIGCRECGKKLCPLFSNRLLSRLRSKEISDGKWWDIISQETGVELIISSDKLPKHYDRFGVPDFLIFVYKDPRANIFSWCKRKFISDDSPNRKFTSEEIMQGIDWWIKISTNIVDWLENQQSEIAIVKLEDFVKNPKEMTRGISTWVATDFDPSIIDYWKRELHYIGGNHSVKRMDKNRHFYNKISVDERWKNHISKGDEILISESREINSLLRRANECSLI